MIVVVSRIRVINGNADALAEQYRQRRRTADAFPGCLGVEVLRNADRRDEFVVYTRWTDRESYLRYRRDPEFRSAHAVIASIPGGVRVDAEERTVDWYEVLS